jgi:hypothetical protein
MKPYNFQKKNKLALKVGTQTYLILTTDDEVCIPSLSSIILAVTRMTSSCRYEANDDLLKSTEECNRGHSITTWTYFF